MRNSTMKRQLAAATAAALLLLGLLSACGDDPADPVTKDDPGGGDPGDTTIAPSFIADHTVLAAYADLAPAVFDSVRANLRIYYGHTSHGSQIVNGMLMLEDENADLEPPVFTEVSDDLGHNGDVSWAAVTRNHLAAHAAETEVVMWSWCGGVSDNDSAGIATYLEAMTALEVEYPDIVFIYMTGHLDGTGLAGNLHRGNEQIRAYCRDREKVLFDFADIESYDPDGAHYPDASDVCEWCFDWAPANGFPACDGTPLCAHSHCFNCYIKGKVFWCLLAALVAD